MIILWKKLLQFVFYFSILGMLNLTRINFSRKYLHLFSLVFDKLIALQILKPQLRR